MRKETKYSHPWLALLLITVHNEIINLILEVNSDSSKTSLNQGSKEFVKENNEIPDILLNWYQRSL